MFKTRKQSPTREERNQCIQRYSELELKPGLKECFTELRKEGYSVVFDD